MIHLCNSGMNTVAVSTHYLMRFKAYSMRWRSCPLSQVAKNLIPHRPRRRTKYYCSAKGTQQSNDFQRYSAIPIDQCLIQLSLKKLPPGVDGNQYRDPRLNSVQRVRNFGTLSPKGDVLTKPSLLRAQGAMWEKKDCKSQRE